MDEQSRQAEFAERYAAGSIPWDDELPPPELIELVQEINAGKALDLGCGYGRASIYLAQHGWQVDGIDFVPRAIEIARERASKSNLNESIQFHVASVAKLDFLQETYDLAVDIGCMHSMPLSALVSYRDGLLRLLNVGGIYLLFAHLGDGIVSDEEPIRWIQNEELLALFAEGFELLFADYGETQVGDNPPWKSAWFRFQRVDF